MTEKNKKNLDAVRQATEIGRKTAPTIGEQHLRYVREGIVGPPALVHTPEGKAAFWIVPFILEGKACGFARVELALKMSSIGTFGAGGEDRASWIDKSFFKEPPPSLLAEVKEKYLRMILSEPILSYDRSPSHWAWRIEVQEEENAPIHLLVYITPGGWYKRPYQEDKKSKIREG